jgi:hypothetical protein
MSEDSLRRQQEKAAFDAEYQREEERLRNLPKAPPKTVVLQPLDDMTRRQKQEFKEHQQSLADQAAQEEFERLAPLRAAERQFRDTANEVARAERAFAIQDLFKKPSEEIAKRTRQFSVTEEMASITVSEFAQTVSQSFVEFQKLLKKLDVTLTQAGKRKLFKICGLNTTADTRVPETFMQIFDYGVELGVFTEEDASGLENLNQVPDPPDPLPEPEPTVADINAAIEAQEGQTREGAKRLKALAVEGIVTAAQPVYQEFANYLVQTFDRYITKAEADQCVDWLRRNNLRLDDIRNWHRARKRVLQLLTPEEAYEEQMSIDADTLTGPEFAKKYRLKVNRGTLG